MEEDEIHDLHVSRLSISFCNQGDSVVQLHLSLGMHLKILETKTIAYFACYLRISKQTLYKYMRLVDPNWKSVYYRVPPEELGSLFSAQASVSNSSAIITITGATGVFISKMSEAGLSAKPAERAEASSKSSAKDISPRSRSPSPAASSSPVTPASPPRFVDELKLQLEKGEMLKRSIPANAGSAAPPPPRQWIGV
ncbi:hypothetical protein SELMODRAFT_427306 [Selaginella moellendorffii]|uniref:Uncharacterized protein n=1 Tax=Selaginella moellendorffii TaxID=88036 RepID=D8SZ67_SELML|nr:hypothetical protein SELMODRAFT_427306 [Selaginella moellendorffii]